MAEIFLAKQVGAEGFERNVVIKRILYSLSARPEFVEMFLHEAKLAARLSHQNIVQIHDLGFAEGCHYICMEYLPGEDFSTVLSAFRRRQAHMPVGVALRVVADAARGLHYAHEMRDEQGKPLHIVHRDISPSNLFITYEGQVKVLDFGVAKAETQVVRTKSGAVRGKHQYMAPEQARGEAVDRRADVYSLGVTLYEALTLTRPFSRDGELAVLKAVMDGKFKPLHALRPDLPVEMEELVHRAMAASPDGRFRTADEMANALERYMEEHASTASTQLVAGCVRELAGEERIAQRTRIRSAGAFGPRLRSTGTDAAPVRTPSGWTPLSAAAGEPGASSGPSGLRWLVPATVSAVCAAAVIAAGSWWMSSRPRDEAHRAAEEIRRRIAAGRLLDPGEGALPLLAAAQARFPDAPELPALRPPLAEALRQDGARALAAGQLQAATRALEASLQLAPGDAAATAALAEAKRSAFATGAGMVRAGGAWIDRYEYPNVKGVMPMTRVDLGQAEELCGKAGKRLCTEAEWERACAGSDRRAFPYGPEHQAGRCQEGPRETGPAPSGSRDGCVTLEGVADLSGNVAEWTSSPVVPGSPQRVVRGGAWHPGDNLSCMARDYFLPGE
ncbi:MAG TPA: bifunctional serine/threonine-protein kinase/formylglycine-generating enzyme family protein, partial [Myxococcales bacterium]|nr:bifunctional serine/threonine-protein kinase/formylglycine-generating enzyme family protein [Myxococcales bacterium]